MTVVLGSLEQLRRQPLDEGGRWQLGRAEWGLRRVAWLTRQVLFQAQETGLGLWMAHRFASECGGTVKIETAPGQGTTVRLVLPYAGQATQD